MKNILVIGNGGREHAIAKALKKDNPDINIYNFGSFLNPGLEEICEVGVDTDILDFVKTYSIDLAIIGPEAYLERGISDYFEQLNIKCIGPKRQLAKLETSKGYTREKMQNEWGLAEYNPKYDFFYDMKTLKSEDMVTMFNKYKNDYVIKEDGLNGGKGVKLSGEHFENDGEAYTHCNELVTKGSNFLFEEKLVGDEFSLMSFCDGETLKSMPIVQDFKRAGNDNKGLNTGGMGCISHTNHRLDFLTEDDVAEAHSVNERIIDNLQKDCEDTYVGIVYGSFMKLKSGELKVIEYNCRFGDPECINVLSLLETNLLDIFKAMVNGTLKDLDITYESACTVCRYIVPEGYPCKPVKDVEITLGPVNKENIIFSSVEKRDNKLYLKGSRAVAVIAKSDTLENAVDVVENEIGKITGPVFSRTDIGKVQFTYMSAGVDIDKGNRVVNNIQKYIQSTCNEHTFDNYGDFGGLFKFGNSVLVSSTDGVGTKSIMAEKLFGDEGYYNLGKDIVNHSVNDILVKGAKPLFFLDYFAASKLCTKQVELFVKGASEACKEVGCVLIGGETAEMPGVYKENRADLVGTIVGSVELPNLIDGKKNIKAGDILVGLKSDGPHTNGFTLLRMLYDSGKINKPFAEKLMKPHRCYLRDVEKIRNAGILINALCHITGGGLIDNPKRVLPDERDIVWNDFEMSDMFKGIQAVGSIDDVEMKRVFNCGIGMIVFIPREQKEKFMGLFDQDYIVDLGVVVKSEKNI